MKAPLIAVAQFHSNASALKKLTPPPMLIQLHDVEPLGEGSVACFTIWLGPLPLKWKAVHRNVGENGFTDIQAAGPMQRWEHTHTFTPVAPDETEIHEHVEYEHKRGACGLLTRGLFSRMNLFQLFFYRKLVTRWSLRGA